MLRAIKIIRADAATGAQPFDVAVLAASAVAATALLL